MIRGEKRITVSYGGLVLFWESEKTSSEKKTRVVPFFEVMCIHTFVLNANENRLLYYIFLISVKYPYIINYRY